jgi:glyoxylase-like metal-dependent hydrolase (beta-lactamase superfamily II)
LKEAGVPLLVLDVQIPAIPLMKQWTKPRDRYVEITTHGNVTISCAESHALLAEVGIPGVILHTPGHSSDSVSLLLDDGSVFIGDLTPIGFAVAEDAATVQVSWRTLWEHGARRVYPAHGPVRSLDVGAIG